MTTQPNNEGNTTTPIKVETILPATEISVNTHLTDEDLLFAYYCIHTYEQSNLIHRGDPEGNVINKQTTLKVEENAQVNFVTEETNNQVTENDFEVTAVDKEAHYHSPIPTRDAAVLNPTTDGPIWAVPLADRQLILQVPDAETFLIGEDEMSAKFFAEHSTLLNSYVVPLVKDVDDPIVTIPLTPYQSLYALCADNSVPVRLQEFIPTTLEFISTFYRRWRGTLVFRFKAVMPAFFNFKLIASLTYGMNSAVEQPTTYGDAMANPSLVMEFDQEHREYTLVVPFASDREWLTAPYQPTVSDLYDKILGELSIWQITNVSTRGTPYSDPPVLQVWMSGKNFQFEDFCNIENIAVQGRSVPVFRGEPESAPYGITANTDRNIVSSTTNTKVDVATFLPPIQLRELAAKWENVDTINIDESTVVPSQVASYKVPLDFITQHAKYALESCAYWKADLVLRFMVNTSTFHGGQIIAYFQPLDYSTPTNPNPDRNRFITSLPHAVIDLSSDMPTSLTIPYRHWGQYYKSSDFGTHGAPITDPTTGYIRFELTSFQTPTGGGGSVSITIQRSWDNFDPIVTRSPASLLTFRGQPQMLAGKRETLSYKPGKLATDPIVEKELQSLHTGIDDNIDTSHSEEKETVSHNLQSMNRNVSSTTTNVATVSQDTTNTEPTTVTKVLHDAARFLPLSTPQNLYELARRPLFIKKLTSDETLVTTEAIFQQNDMYYSVPQENYLALLKHTYGMFAGNITLHIVSTPGKGIDFFYMPYNPTGGSEPPLYSYSSLMSADTPMTQMTFADTVSKDSSYTAIDVPIRKEYRTIPTVAQDYFPGPLFTPIIALAPHGAGNTPQDLYIYMSYSDGARNGMFLGTPVHKFVNKALLSPDHYLTLSGLDYPNPPP